MIGLGTVGAILGSAAGRYVLVVAAAGVLALGIRQSGYNAAKRDCDAAAVRSQLAAVQRDLDAERKARAQDQKAIGELAAEKQKAEDSNAALRDEIKKLPVGDQCIVPPDRAKRMR